MLVKMIKKHIQKSAYNKFKITVGYFSWKRRKFLYDVAHRGIMFLDILKITPTKMNLLLLNIKK